MESRELRELEQIVNEFNSIGASGRPVLEPWRGSVPRRYWGSPGGTVTGDVPYVCTEDMSAKEMSPYLEGRIGQTSSRPVAAGPCGRP
jgi:hypothetical protein